MRPADAGARSNERRRSGPSLQPEERGVSHTQHQVTDMRPREPSTGARNEDRSGRGMWLEGSGSPGVAAVRLWTGSGARWLSRRLGVDGFGGARQTGLGLHAGRGWGVHAGDSEDQGYAGEGWRVGRTPYVRYWGVNTGRGWGCVPPLSRGVKVVRGEWWTCSRATGGQVGSMGRFVWAMGRR